MGSVPQVPTLFTQSRAEGIGFDGDITQRTILSGTDGPSEITLLHSGAGSTTSLAEVTMDSIILPVNTLTSTEELIIEIYINDRSTGGTGIEASLDIIIGLTTNVLGTVGNAKTESRGQIRLVANQDDLDNMKGYFIKQAVNNVSSFTTPSITFAGEAPALTKQITLNLRGNVETAGTMNFSWWVYRRGVLKLA